jgi:hypothetical protein
LRRSPHAPAVAIVIGTHLETEDGLANAAVVFAPAGDELGRYRKRALFGQWEQRTFVRGRGGLRFRCAGFTVGLAICYDVEFPEIVRAEAVAGVDLLVVPTALMSPYDHIATRLVPARALENQIHIAYCNRTGEENGLTYVGLSCICDPQGRHRGDGRARAGPPERRDRPRSKRGRAGRRQLPRRSAPHRGPRPDPPRQALSRASKRFRESAMAAGPRHRPRVQDREENAAGVASRDALTAVSRRANAPTPW